MTATDCLCTLVPRADMFLVSLIIEASRTCERRFGITWKCQKGMNDGNVEIHGGGFHDLTTMLVIMQKGEVGQRGFRNETTYSLHYLDSLEQQKDGSVPSIDLCAWNGELVHAHGYGDVFYRPSDTILLRSYQLWMCLPPPRDHTGRAKGLFKSSQRCVFTVSKEILAV